jgi:uncharacterized membrane protein
MERTVKHRWHHIHPMLTLFPLGLLIMSVVFDIAYVSTGNLTFAEVAYCNIAAGVLGGLVAAAFDVIGWLNIPSDTRAKTLGRWHGVGNALVVLLLTISVWLRAGAPAHAPSIAAFLLGPIGIGVGALTGWLGSTLVMRLGVGVDPGAQIDAPSPIAHIAADAHLPHVPDQREHEPVR